jgi:predicted Zn-dependent peptidase
MRRTAGALAQRLARLVRERAQAVNSSASRPFASSTTTPKNRGGIDTAADVRYDGGGKATLAPAIAPFPSWLPRGDGSSDGKDIGRVSTPLTQPLVLGGNGGAATSSSSGGRRASSGAAPPPPLGASPPTRTTVLPNGAAVVTEASRGPTSSLGVYVDCGSVHEQPGRTLGASAVLECSAFGATLHRPGGRLAAEVGRLGATVSANASREQMAYTLDCLRTHLPQAAELLLDATLCPAFDPSEVAAHRARLQEAVASGPEVQLALMAEALLREAYRGSPLANPLIPASCVSDEEAKRLDEASARAEAAAQAAREAVAARGGSEVEQEAGAAEARAQVMAAVAAGGGAGEGAAAAGGAAAGGAAGQQGGGDGNDAAEVAAAAAAAAATPAQASSPLLGPSRTPYVRPLPLDHLTPESLRQFHAERFFSPGNLVVAGAGVDHDELVALVEPMLLERVVAPSTGARAKIAAAAPPPPPQPSRSLYKGGHVHLPGPHPQSHLILAFEYQGGWRDVQGSVTMTVLTYLLGGGASFSSGGPGKGMHSRLYTRVLNAHAWAHSCAAFSSAFNDTGLVGIQASCEPGRAAQMLDVCCRELESLCDPAPEEQVGRARAMAASLVAGALESKAASAEDVGRQYLTYGRRVSGSEYLSMIRSVTPRQVAELVRSLLSTKPSLATFGDGSAEASYDRVLARYVGGGGMVVSGRKGVDTGAGGSGAGVWRPAAASTVERLKAAFGSGGK